jgi:hypothetical protein
MCSSPQLIGSSAMSKLLNGKAAVLGIEVFLKPEVGLRDY